MGETKANLGHLACEELHRCTLVLTVHVSNFPQFLHNDETVLSCLLFLLGLDADMTHADSGGNICLALTDDAAAQCWALGDDVSKHSAGALVYYVLMTSVSPL